MAWGAHILGRKGQAIGSAATVGLILALFVAARWPWRRHLLAWDEAITLCSLRAFAARGTDYYSNWFWRHPPLVSLLWLLARPLQPNYDSRMAAVTVLLAAGACVALFFLQKRVFGWRVAAWSALCLALMPGAIFYDVWLKQDVGVSLLGLGALYAFLAGRVLWAGLILGLAFLSKELAAFYATAILLLALLRRSWRSLKEAGVTLMIAAITAAWWYVLFSNSLRGLWRFATDLSYPETQAWRRPWYFYLQQMSNDLEAWGLALTLAGLIALLVRARQARDGSRPQGFGDVSPLWPLAVLWPAYVVISAVPGKPPWYVISLFPAWAALEGVGMDALWRAIRGDGANRCRRALATTAAAAVVAVAVHGRLGADYEDWFRSRDPGLCLGSALSREAAEELNRLVAPGQTVLLTPMHYWRGAGAHPCPVLVCYLKDFPVVVRRGDMPADAFVEVVRRHRVSWALVSPDPDESWQLLVDPLARKYGLWPRMLGGALIYRTDGLWRAAGPEEPEPTQAEPAAHPTPERSP